MFGEASLIPGHALPEDMPLACTMPTLPTCAVALMCAGAMFMWAGIAAGGFAAGAAVGPFLLTIFGAVVCAAGLACLVTYLWGGPEKAPPLEATEDGYRGDPMTELLLGSDTHSVANSLGLRHRNTDRLSFKQPNDDDDASRLQQTAHTRASWTSAYRSVYSAFSFSGCSWFSGKKQSTASLDMQPLNWSAYDEVDNAAATPPYGDF